jgi:hypothetical protein
MGLGFIIAFKDFSVIEPLSIFYNQLYKKLSTSFKFCIKSIINRLNNLVDSSDNINKTEAIDIKTNSDSSLRSEYKNPLIKPNTDSVATAKKFYTSPYFYVTVILLLSGGYIYYNYDSITTYIVT